MQSLELCIVGVVRLSELGPPIPMMFGNTSILVFKKGNTGIDTSISFNDAVNENVLIWLAEVNRQ